MKVKDLKKLLNKYDEDLEIYILEQPTFNAEGDIIPLHEKLIIKEKNMKDFIFCDKNKYLTYHFDPEDEQGLIINHKKNTYEDIDEEEFKKEEEELNNIECNDIILI